MPRISIPDDSPPVLATSAVFPALQARAELDYNDTLPVSEDMLTERIRAAEVVLNIRASSPFTARVCAACPRLRMLSVWGTGTDHVDLASAARHGVTVTNTPGVSARSIAEHALALLFAVARRIPQMDAATRLGAWPRGRSIELHGKTCGVVGYGAIADDAAGLAVQFDGASARPRAEARRGVHLRNVARHGEQQGERVLGDGAGAHSGRVGNGDAVPRGTGQIDVVGAGAPDGEQAQARTGGEDARREARGGADVEHHFGRVDALRQYVFGDGQGVVIVEFGARLDRK